MVKEFEFISFFRAIAAFWVMAVHCVIWGGGDATFLPNPKIAVDLFMMISGFLMVSNSVARQRSEPLTEGRSIYRFWIRRFFRIAPAYYFSLLLAVFFADHFLDGYGILRGFNPTRWEGHGGYVYDPSRIQYDLSNVLWHMTFLFGLHPEFSFSTMLPDWSLSLEMQFYFVFPFLFVLFASRSPWWIAIVGAVTWILGRVVAHKVEFFEPSLIFFKLPFFLAGMCIYWFISSDHGSGGGKRLAFAATAVFLSSIELLHAIRAGLEFKYSVFLIMQPALCLAMLRIGLAEHRSGLSGAFGKIVSNGAVRFASETSYGVYLFHGFPLAGSALILSSLGAATTLNTGFRLAFVLVFVTFFSYLAAYIVLRMVENPGIDLGRRVLKRYFE